MIDPATQPGARALDRLERELHLWLTTVAPSGQPQPSPIWFLWIGGEILLQSLADTPRVANIRANPLVDAHFDSNGHGGDIVVIEGEARIVRERTTVADLPPAYVEKYAAAIAREGWTLESFVADYPVEIRVRPTRLRGW